MSDKPDTPRPDAETGPGEPRPFRRLPRKPGSGEVEPEDVVDEAGDETFPASDPPPWTP